jgi:hypothetical protein
MRLRNLLLLGVVPVAIAASSASASGNTNCNGTQSKNVSGNLNVPSGDTCTIAPNVKIGGNVTVNSKATLIDQGASVAGNIQATSPKGIGIGGTPTAPGSVAQGISISGTTGSASGGNNYICNTNIGQSVLVTATASGAGRWIIGDQDESCTYGPDQIAQSLTVTNNKVRVDISDNKKGTTPPYMVGIGQALLVTGNTVVTTPPYSPVVENNFIGQSATCQVLTREDADGSRNFFGQSNNGCPAT